MKKFGRNYSIEIGTLDGKSLTFKLPVTIEFDINRNSMQSLNTSEFTLYNLSPEHRRLLQKNQFNFASKRYITFVAGYAGNISVAYTGEVLECNSYRQGVDYLTNISCQDAVAGIFDGSVQETFPAGLTRKKAIEKLAKSMPGVKLGAIGDGYDGVLNRGISMDGKAYTILQQLSDGTTFIDNGKVNILRPEEYIEIDGPDTVIDASYGLLETPVREGTYLNLLMVFEPRLIVGQKVTLKSSTETWMNGDFRLISLHHSGMISDSVCGDAKTGVGLLAPSLGFVDSKTGKIVEQGKLTPYKSAT